MWLFTKYGFFSVVSARKGFGEPGKPVDPDRVMIRSRSRTHLKQLKDRFVSLQGSRIESFSHSDYPFRVFVQKAVWSLVMKDLADELDYDNFKGVIGRQPDEGKYLDCVHDVWAIMRRLEEN